MPRPRGKPQDGELSPERLAFCEGILAGKSLRVAYEESGFRARGRDAKTNGRQLLREPEIQVYLAARRTEMQERTKLRDQRIIAEIAAIAFLDPAEIVAEEIEGPADIAKLPERVRRAIVGWKYNALGQFEIKLADKLKALEMLGKIHGLYQRDRENEADRAVALLKSPFWRYVYALRERDGLTLPEAMLRARAEPEAVEAFAEAHGLLPPGDSE